MDITRAKRIAGIEGADGDKQLWYAWYLMKQAENVVRGIHTDGLPANVSRQVSTILRAIGDTERWIHGQWMDNPKAPK